MRTLNKIFKLDKEKFKILFHNSFGFRLNFRTNI